MIQRDYVMRLVQQLSQALTQVLFRKESKQYQEALEDVQQAGQLFLGLDLNAVEVLTYEDLHAALRAKNATDTQHTSLVAELLRHQGDCFAFERHAEAARRSYTLALDLYLDLAATGGGPQLADLATRIDLLLEHLDPLALAPDAQRKLFRHLAAAGRYAEAEDVLFHLADTHPTPALYEEGLAFFERLLRMSHRYLKAGNLPYAEVKEGLAAFQRRMKHSSPGHRNVHTP